MNLRHSDPRQPSGLPETAPETLSEAVLASIAAHVAAAMTDEVRAALSEAATALRVVREVDVVDEHVARAAELLAVIPRLTHPRVVGDDHLDRVRVATLSIPADVAVVVAGHALEHARVALAVAVHDVNTVRHWAAILDHLGAAAAVLRLEALRRATAKLDVHSRRGPRPRAAS